MAHRTLSYMVYAMHSHGRGRKACFESWVPARECDSAIIIIGKVFNNFFELTVRHSSRVQVQMHLILYLGGKSIVFLFCLSLLCFYNPLEIWDWWQMTVFKVLSKDKHSAWNVLSHLNMIVRGTGHLIRIELSYKFINYKLMQCIYRGYI